MQDRVLERKLYREKTEELQRVPTEYSTEYRPVHTQGDYPRLRPGIEPPERTTGNSICSHELTGNLMLHTALSRVPRRVLPPREK